MSKNILLISFRAGECQTVASELQKCGYDIMEYHLDSGQEGFWETLQREVDELLSKIFFYFVLSLEYHDNLYKICLNSGTKYVTYSGPIQQGLINSYTLLQERSIFTEEEAVIYDTINESFWERQRKPAPIKGLEYLGGIQDEEQVRQLTDVYFSRLEEDGKLRVRLKEQLLKYIDSLLCLQSVDSWREISLWNKRHECRALENFFWEFFVIKKSVAIFSEEMLEYYKAGDIPSILQFTSFAELSETYFHLLLLLRRLNYNVAPEENRDIIHYILEKRLSWIFVRHVVEYNQIENKVKVYQRLEELLEGYEQ